MFEEIIQILTTTIKTEKILSHLPLHFPLIYRKRESLRKRKIEQFASGF